MKILSIRSDEQLPQTIRMIIYWFKIIGLAPFSLRQTKSSIRNSRKSYYPTVFLFSQIGLAYNVVLSIVILITGALAIPQLSSMKYSKKSSITSAIDVTQGVIRTATSCIIILSSALKQRKAISIMNGLLQVDRLLSSISQNSSNERKTSFVFMKIQMIANAVLWVIFWLSEEAYIKSFLHGFIVNVPIFVIHWFVLEYSITLGILAKDFERLNKSLLSFQEFPDYSFRTPIIPNDYNHPVFTLSTHNDQLVVLELMNNIFVTLVDVSQDIGDFFSFPMLPTVACFFVALVYNLYYLIIPMVVGSISDAKLSTDINASTWVFVCAYPLISLSFNVGKTLNQAKLIGSIIHKVLATATRPEIQIELKRFSHQLIHKNIKFTAYGFFSLDFTLIQSIFGAMATYLIIIVQFTQSAANTP